MKCRSQLRRTEWKRPTHIVRRSRAALKAGKQTYANKRANATLAKEFKGEHTCEAKLEGCLGQCWLSWAHPAKRRNLTPEELTTAALCCVPCHEKLERLSHEDMRVAVMEIIERRAA